MALTRKIVLEATPAEVWDKVATGPGLSSWYVPHEVEPRKGGIGRADFGGGTHAEGRIQVYEPGRRIIFRGEAAAPDVGAEPKKLEEAPTLEFSISENGDVPEGFADAPFRGIGDVRGRRRRPGSPRTVLHFRQTGFPEVAQEVFEEGWDIYFYNLTQSFAHFRGKTAVTTAALAIHQQTPREAFAALSKGLGVDPDQLEEGKEVRLTPSGLEPIEGVVDLRMSTDHIDALGLINEAALIRYMADEACGGGIFQYQWLVDPPPDIASVRAQGNQWQGWLQEQFA